RMAGDLRRAPLVAVAFAGKLMAEARWAAADAVLEGAAATSAEACAMWAELALRLGDFQAAERRARAVRINGADSPQWTSWYDRFMERLARERLAGQERRTGGARSKRY
ncbi:MAG: hypothetical protein N3A38_15235, partial [Planctomycetota bacterium]|nr:hypothetical protein [Planctomycetota bacterium]